MRKFVALAWEDGKARDLKQYIYVNNITMDILHFPYNEMLFKELGMKPESPVTLFEVKGEKYIKLAETFENIYKMYRGGLLDEIPDEINLDKRDVKNDGDE